MSDRQKEMITAQDSTNQGNEFTISLASDEENAQWEKENTRICSITGKTYVGYGNNAYPFPGKCSDEANRKYVIPARIMGLTPGMIDLCGIDAICRFIDENMAV